MSTPWWNAIDPSAPTLRDEIGALAARLWIAQQVAYPISAPDCPLRAWLDLGRVVQLTPRAVGRFQTLPDWYVLPDKRELAFRLVGNGVSVELARRLMEGLLPCAT